MLRRLFFLLVVLILICFGIKRFADFAMVKVKLMMSSKDLQKGWTRVESDDKSVSIGLPPAWHKADLSKPIKAQGSTGKTLDPSGFKLVFVGTPPAGQKLRPNGNIISLHTDLDLETLAQKSKEGIETDAKDLTMADDVLVGEPAKVMSYMKVDHFGHPIDHIGYIGLKGGNEYLCSFGFPQGTPDEKDTAHKIAATMTAN